VIPTRLPGVLLFEPAVFHDDRGYFLERWNRVRMAAAGLDVEFVQDNLSFSRHGVLRGLHLQAAPYAQGKLVSVLQGSIYDVAVDLRPDSPTHLQWLGMELSAENRRHLYIPEGFAHGFVVTGESALVSYQCTHIYVAEADRSVRWDDPHIGVQWPIADPVLSAKDRNAPLLRELALSI
jgi:dTDP-4-dehydrorhamnose 3,5-epimerase